jgi:hypothetical protein
MEETISRIPPPPPRVSFVALQKRAREVAVHILRRFPRELRDQIYSYLFYYPDTQPISLSHTHLRPLDSKIDPSRYLSAPWVGPLIASETVEIFYGQNAFIVPLSTPLNESLTFCRWDSGTNPSAFIRHLTIELTEDVSFNCRGVTCASGIIDDQYYEQLCRPAPRRANLTCLLNLPRLEKLEFRIQKASEGPLELRDINPLLRHLRAARPHLHLSLAVSFDAFLKAEWDEWDYHYGDRLPGLPQQAQEVFKPAGYSDCSELIAAPSEEDRSYVKEYLPDGVMPQGRRAQPGMLNESVGTRLALQACYACQEPALMRVKLERHWEFWQGWEEKDQICDLRRRVRADVEIKMNPTHVTGCSLSSCDH